MKLSIGRTPTGSELQREWIRVLPRNERIILNILIQHWPDEVEMKTLKELSGLGGRRLKDYLQRMKSKQVIDFDERGRVKASDTLFDAKY